MGWERGCLLVTMCWLTLLDEIADIRGWYCFCSHRQSMSGAFYFDTFGLPFRPHLHAHTHTNTLTYGVSIDLSSCCAIAGTCNINGGEAQWAKCQRANERGTNTSSTTNDRIRYIRLSKFVLCLDGFAVVVNIHQEECGRLGFIHLDDMGGRLEENAVFRVEDRWMDW